MDHILVESGFSKDVTTSVTSVSIDSVPDAKRRVQALETLKNKDGFEPLAVAFKRVVNILRKAGITQGGTINAALFEKPCESELLDAVDRVKGTVSALLETADYDGALAEIATLRAPVDTFFDDVMVMADDDAVRTNRMVCCHGLRHYFPILLIFQKLRPKRYPAQMPGVNIS
jgi:glycyl-tRNA synthetase beta chain